MTKEQAVVLVGLVILLTVLKAIFRRGKRPLDDLDRPLFRLGANDVMSVRDLLNGGLLVTGITGSGKSSSSGRQLGIALARDPNTYGLILSAKPVDDLAMWKRIFANAGQSDRLLVFDADQSPLRFNFLAEAARGGSTRDIVQCILTISETLRFGSHAKGGDNDAFWRTQTERVLHHAVEVLQVARGAVTASELQQFISTAAVQKASLHDPGWRTSFHSQCLERAHATPKSTQGQHDYLQAVDFWCSEFPQWEDRLRTSVLAQVFGVLFIFNSGLVHERVSTTTNFTFDDLRRERRWLLVDTSPSALGPNGTFIGAGFKFLMQRYVLRQAAGVGDPIHVIWCDEAQQWANEFDGAYIAQCRSHRGCLVFLTQSIHGFHPLDSGNNKAKSLTLLGNFATRIFHALGDVETAHWASESLGQRLETHIGGSSQPSASILDEMMGRGQFTSNFSSQYEPVLQPAALMTGLTRMGGPAHDYLCDALVIRPGRPFSSGENYLHVVFSQR